MSQAKIIVRTTMGDAGAGKIGNYSHCSYSVDGVCTYKPTKGANHLWVRLGSLKRLRKNEIDTLNGTLVKFANDLGIKVPVNEHIYQTIKNGN